MNSLQPKPGPFKTCTICRTVWQTRNDFMGDPDIFIIGYQVHFNALTEGLFLFNHSCRGTLTIRAGEFTDLYEGPVFRKRMTGTEQCPGHCLHEKDLAPCPAKCECAFVRDVVRIIEEWHKRQALHEKRELHEIKG